MSASIELVDTMAAPPLVLVPERLHFSCLKLMARSPAHAHHALTSVRGESTPAMRLGTIVHHLVCGPHTRRPLVRYEGEKRVGNDWKDFERRTLREHGPLAEIVTEAEWRKAEPAALAVLADPVARELIEGSRREVALQWEDAGILCETDGIDGVNDAKRLIWDLKWSGVSSAPEEFSRHATRMSYPAQMAWFERAARANGIATDGGVHLIAVEAEPPYVATVLRLPPDALAAGERALGLWMERYRVCRDSGVWPGYTQSVVDFVLPAWAGEAGAEETAED